MLELDECDELLTNGFTNWSHHQGLLRFHSANRMDNASPSHALTSHPLRSPSASVVEDFSKIIRPQLPCTTRSISENGLDRPPAVQASDNLDETDTNLHHDDNDDILHTISSEDSLAAVALRYGVSLAALRHANQLWPSDPIHIRTQLIIPRRRARRTKRKAGFQDKYLSTSQEIDPVSPSPSTSTASLSSTLLAARDTVLLAFPGRISIDSLNSRISTNEDLELENLIRRPLPSRTSEMESPCGVELDTLSFYRPNYMPAHDITSLLNQHDAPPTQLRHLTSEPTLKSVSNRAQEPKPNVPISAPASVFVPVRTSQLEPEPAMELSSRIKSW